MGANAIREPLDIGAMMRRFRARKGMSQAMLAEIADCDSSYISRVENGSRRPEREWMTQISEALGLSQYEATIFLASAGYTPIGQICWPSALQYLLTDDTLPSGVRESAAELLESTATSLMAALQLHYTLRGKVEESEQDFAEITEATRRLNGRVGAT